MFRLPQKKFLRDILLPNICIFLGLTIYFTGAELTIALTLATGIRGGALQEKIDACETKAIAGTDFTDEEIEFLGDLYTCLYKGARLTFVLSEVSKMMEHYLARSGEPLEIDASIFNTNDKVIEKMVAIKTEIRASPELRASYRSDEFYMPDFSNIDSVFGLYYGHIIAKPTRVADTIQIQWRAEVPWEWPSYALLEAKHGTPHAESFPIPNASCLFLGIEGAIFIDNGLGEYLTHLGLATSFVAFAEWMEISDD